MPLDTLDHVNIRSANVDALARFYVEVLGLTDGARPPFHFDGRWLYLGERAVIHLVEVDAQPQAHEPALEHFAFRGRGLATFVAGVESAAVDYRLSVVPSTGLRQVHLRDPDGNHVEVGFDAAEPLPDAS